MKLRIWLFGMLVLVALVVSACGGVAQPSDRGMEKAGAESATPEDDHVVKAQEKDSENAMAGNEPAATAEKPVGGMVDKDEPQDTTEAGDAEDTMTESGSEAVGDDSMDTMESESTTDLPTWFGAELRDVNTGATLTVADLFEDQVVLVETMAIWCSNCLRQQQEVKALHEVLGERDDLVTLVLDVDANEDAGNLRAYAEKHGFSWLYAVAPREVAREIGQLYGDQFLNPPSTPMLIIDRQGEVHLLPFGRKTAEDLREALAAFLDVQM